LAFVLVWSGNGGEDKQFEVFADRRAAEKAAVERRREGGDAYVVSGDLPDVEGLDPTSPDHMFGGFKL